jgi:hypothetical protein
MKSILIGFSILILLSWFAFVVAYCERKRKTSLTPKERIKEAEEDRFNSQW